MASYKEIHGSWITPYPITSKDVRSTPFRGLWVMSQTLGFVWFDIAALWI